MAESDKPKWRDRQPGDYRLADTRKELDDIARSLDKSLRNINSGLKQGHSLDSTVLASPPYRKEYSEPSQYSISNQIYLVLGLAGTIFTATSAAVTYHFLAQGEIKNGIISGVVALGCAVAATIGLYKSSK